MTEKETYWSRFAHDFEDKSNYVVVEKQNCFHLSYDNGSFDTVLMANRLHIIPKPENAPREANRVLKNSGSIIVISYTMDGMKLIHKAGMIYRYMKTWGKPSPHAKTLKLKDYRIQGATDSAKHEGGLKKLQWSLF